MPGNQVRMLKALKNGDEPSYVSLNGTCQSAAGG